MSIQGIYDGVAAGVYRRETTGTSVIVVAPAHWTESLPRGDGGTAGDTIREAGVRLFAILHPERIPGGVLHVEQIDEQRWEVVVEDRGPRVIGKGF